MHDLRAARFDTLFTRFLLLQAVLAVGLTVTLWGSFYLERNATIATLYAQRWAPGIAAAAGLDGLPGADDPAIRREAPPPGTRRPPPLALRFMALRDALADAGIVVDDLRLAHDGSSRLWLSVAPGHGSAVWLVVSGDVVIRGWPRRATVALGSSAALLVAASWWFTRRLTRPLAQLRARMEASDPARGTAPPAPVRPTAEVAAIARAHDDLLERFARFDRERAVLLAGVSHDLRSPLARIRMASALLPSSPDVDPRRETIDRDVGVLDRLIESFLDFVRSSELPCDETVDLATVARETLARLGPQAPVSLEAPEPVRLGRVNRILLERVLSNLVENALVHGRPPVQVRVTGAGNDALLEVDDHGDGIDPSDVERLQEAFTRGEGHRARPGLGLGLAIVRGIVDRFDGTLAFSRHAGGLRVRVSLPAARRADRTPGPLNHWNGEGHAPRGRPRPDCRDSVG